MRDSSACAVAFRSCRPARNRKKPAATSTTAARIAMIVPVPPPPPPWGVGEPAATWTIGPPAAVSVAVVPEPEVTSGVATLAAAEFDPVGDPPPLEDDGECGWPGSPPAG